MAVLLCIETSSVNCSVSLFDNGSILSSREASRGYSHAEKLHLFIQEVLEESGKSMRDLQGLVLGSGPGSFTGLRIGSSAAKGLCYALNLPLMTVPSLYNMAVNVRSKFKPLTSIPSFTLCSMVDARRMEVYCAMYDQDLNETEPAKPMILDPHSFDDLLETGPVVFFGDGMNKMRHFCAPHPNAYFAEDFLPSSLVMSELGEEKFRKQDFEDVAYFEPFYLKGFQATTPKKLL